ncbi:MAG: SCP2 sterol-binding domain-containing protein [Dehalococcoidia bacterium]|nr:SCP2 sterol-binding domain-containing protein [Dehalococcoidia bacterium]
MARLRFLGAEYMEEALKRTRENSEYQQASEGFDDTLAFVVEPEPDKGIDERRTVGTILPQATEYWMDDRPVTFTFLAPYSVYVDIMTGKLDAVRAITKGALKLKGPMPKILRYVKGTNLWMDTLRTIPTQFEGDFADRSFG